MTRALKVPVTTTPSQANALTIPEGFINPQLKAFLVVNPNTCWVGLRGTSRVMGQPDPTQATLANSDGADWLFPPHHFGVYSTQSPLFMSAIALAMPGFPVPGELTELRVYYGVGA